MAGWSKIAWPVLGVSVAALFAAEAYFRSRGNKAQAGGARGPGGAGARPAVQKGASRPGAAASASAAPPATVSGVGTPSERPELMPVLTVPTLYMAYLPEELQAIQDPNKLPQWVLAVVQGLQALEQRQVEMAARLLSMALQSTQSEVPTAAYGVSLTAFAYLYARIQESAKAAAMYAQAVKVWEAVMGEGNPGLLLPLADYGFMCKITKDAKEGIATYERALALTDDLSPADRAILESGLAETLSEDGRAADALPLYRSALALRKEALGEKHPLTAGALFNLAKCLRALDQAAEADELDTQWLPLFEANHKDDLEGLVTLLGSLAEISRAQAHMAHARTLYKHALHVAEEKLPTQPNEGTAVLLNNMSDLLRECGDTEGAASAITRAVEVMEKVKGPDAPELGPILVTKARQMTDSGAYDEAEVMYERALAVLGNADEGKRALVLAVYARHLGIVGNTDKQAVVKSELEALEKKLNVTVSLD